MLILRIILTSELLSKLMLYRICAKYYTRRFLVIATSQSFCSEDLHAGNLVELRKLLMLICLWRIFGVSLELALYATAQNPTC